MVFFRMWMLEALKFNLQGLFIARSVLSKEFFVGFWFFF